MEGAGKKYFTYRIEKWVGTDSYGTLYRAYDEALDRTAALKVLSPGLAEGENLVNHFRKNMQQLAQLTHPGIPQIYYFGKQGKEYFVALEWLQGSSLSNLIRKDGRMPLPQALDILRQCIDALSAAWKLGIAHGNLKPNNVLVDQNHKVQITDFGLAVEKPRDFENQTVSGATSFMAPEIADSKTIDFRTDIYSLGLILYYMLLNSLPSHPSLQEISRNDSSDKVLPAGVGAVIDRMIQQEPKDRYDSYDELTSDIEALDTAVPSESMLSVPRILRQDQNPLYVSDSMFDLLARLYKEKCSGILIVKWLKLQKQFLVNRGEIVFFESTQPNENMAGLVKANNWISASLLDQETRTPEALVQLVLRKGGCSLDQFREAYLRLMQDALSEVFRWPVFQGEFFRGEIASESFAAIRLSNILLEASRTLVSDDWFKQKVSLDSLIKKNPGFEELLASFALNSEESFLAYRLEGEDMNPVILTILTGLSEERVLRIVSLLQSIGAIELRPVVATQPEQPLRKPAPVTSLVVPSSPPVKETPTRERVFPPPAPAPPIPAAPQAPPQAAMAAKQKGRFEDALIPPEPQRPMKATAPVTDNKRIRAENYYQQAQGEYDAGNYGKAAYLCKEAIQCRNAAEYFHLLGASYAHHPRFQRDAEEAMHTAITLAPTEADYHASLATFYTQKELWLRARTHCLKALELRSEHSLAKRIYQTVLENKPGKGNCWCVAKGSE